MMDDRFDPVTCWNCGSVYHAGCTPCLACAALRKRLDAAEKVEQGVISDLENAKSVIKRLLEDRAKTEAALCRAREAITALRTMRDTEKPRKLDEALSWRENDELAEKMAQAALSSSYPCQHEEEMSKDNYDTLFVQRGAEEAFRIAVDDARKLRKETKRLLAVIDWAHRTGGGNNAMERISWQAELRNRAFEAKNP